MIQFDSVSLEKFLEHLRPEGNPRIHVAPTSPPTDVQIPEPWEAALAEKDAYGSAVQPLWAPAQKLVPQIIDTLARKLRGLTLLTSESQPPSLVYLFTREDRIYAHRGYAATQTLPEIVRGLPVSLAEFYGVHDGWVDILSLDMGPLPSDLWGVLSRDEKDGVGFLELFTNGTTALGFDLAESPPAAYTLWSDGQVDAVKDFWPELDQWVAESLEQMDDAD